MHPVLAPPAGAVRGRRPQRGIALVAVLWVVFLLTVIVSSFVYNARAHVQATGNQLSRVRAQALADAGVQKGLYEMLKPATDAGRWQPEGRPYRIALGDGVVTVSILDETAFIDLNAAPEPLLMGLLASAGVEEGDARVLVDAIQDWRDLDDLPRASGAERDQYLAAGLKRVPSNQDFRSVEELKAVIGMSAELYDRIAGALTVHTQSAGINGALAPRQVLLALPGTRAEDVDAYLAARREDLEAGLRPAPFPAAAAYGVAAAGLVYNFRSEAVLPDGTVFVREAVAGVTQDPRHPFGFLSWREGRPTQRMGDTS